MTLLTFGRVSNPPKKEEPFMRILKIWVLGTGVFLFINTPALGYEGNAATYSQAAVRPSSDSAPSQVIALDDKEFGKY